MPIPVVFAAEVIDAIEAVYPVIEVVGTRFAEPVGAYPLIADAGGNAALLVGDPLKTTVDYLANHLDKEVAVKVNGKVEGKGNGKDVLGNPLHALEWVANTLQRVGLQLRAGDTVSTGTMTGVLPWQSFHVSFASVFYSCYFCFRHCPCCTW